MAEESKKVSEKVEKMVEEVAKLSVLELSELVSALQDKLGVSAMPVAVAAPAAAVAEAAEAGRGLWPGRALRACPGPGQRGDQTRPAL